MITRLIILDRDGVINEDSDDYIKSPNEWIAIESSLCAIAELSQAGYTIAVASNQSGIARGLFNLNTLESINQKMIKAVAIKGGKISDVEFCTDHPNNAGPFRKPAPGMLNKLIKRYQVDSEQTWFVGDSLSDIKCAKAADCKPALVLTGKGLTTKACTDLDPKVPVFENLQSFANYILNK